MRKGSVKNSRVNAEVMREISNLIQNEIKDPRVSPMASVMGCTVTPDLKYCTVRISVLGSQEELEKTMEGLKASRPFIRKRLAETVNLRNTPEIRFVSDDGIAYGMHLSELIEKVREEDEKHMKERGEAEEETIETES